MRMTSRQVRDLRPELQIHMEILNWLKWQYPQAVIHHSANERKGQAAGKRAKDMGQLAGFPDLIVMRQGHVWCFEVKKKSGKVSKEQKACGEIIERNQFRWAVVRSVEDVQACVAEWSKDVPHLCMRGR